MTVIIIYMSYNSQYSIYIYISNEYYVYTRRRNGKRLEYNIKIIGL
jgi:hypothetical protein